MPKLEIRFSSEPGRVPTVDELDGYKFGWNTHDGIAYGVIRIEGIRYVVPIGSGGGGGISSVIARYSITGDGLEASPLELEGDQDILTGYNYYGTVNGVKGYHRFPLYSIDFEFCISAGTAQDFTLDLYAIQSYYIQGAVFESDGTINEVTISVDSTPITELEDIEVSTLDSIVLTEPFQVGTANRVMLHIGTGTSGTPTVIRGKLICQL